MASRLGLGVSHVLTGVQCRVYHHHHHHHHHHRQILHLNLHYSLRCSLSANTSSIYCRPQRARPSKLTVVGSFRAHKCLTSETFLFNLQSNEGSCPPHHKSPWISSPHYSLTTSSLIDDTITYLFVVDFTHAKFFFHPSVIMLPSQYVGNIRKYSLIGIHG